MSVVSVAKFAIICNQRHNTRVTLFLLLYRERVFILYVNINIRRRQTTTRNSREKMPYVKKTTKEKLKRLQDLIEIVEN